MNDENSLKIVKLISSAGAARSNYIEAIQKAKADKFMEAQELIEEGESFFVEGHKLHAELISNEAAGKGMEVSLLFVHAEDHMISAETTKILAEEIISLYERLKEKFC
ncbi:PTS lactose/cellobiose transporter subunit IIA [Salipaludibacillus sp. LMS25]|jgi:PTS system cellobiose-specific IIA component|uniref:PTS lactose/cellobiose transporter subunit IIA n=1 Tax=Salipaludibacillus sp. LMS25 TaxID=2924031 RepID=UPI0020D1E1BD|nr:PTS lactose/cellobiose transporter subunit IIA [Salipaludibacillus sp. LMS25]UTR15937.1 PTS lactose/cellobiose transporter subunit IIA [Salipaludibacillus sp. LMS25]